MERPESVTVPETVVPLISAALIVPVTLGVTVTGVGMPDIA
jgi:hypothetical protein